jgi:hypothetical protein
MRLMRWRDLSMVDIVHREHAGPAGLDAERRRGDMH